MRLDADRKRKVLELARSQGIVEKCEACGSEKFVVDDVAEPIGEELSGGYTAKVVCEECGTPAWLFEVRTELRAVK
jgi:uncharacterized Zn finger protein